MNTKTQILYIDDEPINLLLFSKLLKNEGYKIFVSNNVLEGLDILNKRPDISIVFCDLQMPDMDGIVFIKKAKQKYPKKKYYLITANSLNNTIQQAIDDKIIDGCLHKPFKKKDICSVIGKSFCFNTQY